MVSVFPSKYRQKIFNCPCILELHFPITWTVQFCQLIPFKCVSGVPQCEDERDEKGCWAETDDLDDFYNTLSPEDRILVRRGHEAEPTDEDRFIVTMARIKFFLEGVQACDNVTNADERLASLENKLKPDLEFYEKTQALENEYQRVIIEYDTCVNPK